MAEDAIVGEDEGFVPEAGGQSGVLLDDFGAGADQTVADNATISVDFGNARADSGGMVGSSFGANNSILAPSDGAYMVGVNLYLYSTNEPTYGDVIVAVTGAASSNTYRLADGIHSSSLKKRIRGVGVPNDRAYWDWRLTLSGAVWLPAGDELAVIVVNRTDVSLDVLHVPTLNYNFADCIAKFGAQLITQ